VDSSTVIGVLGDAFSLVGDLLVLLAVIVALVAAIFAWLTLRSSNLDKWSSQLTDVTAELVNLGEATAEAASSLAATVTELERIRLQDRLVHRLDAYERVSGAVQMIVLAPPGATQSLTGPAREQRIHTAQAAMRAALAAIPGATGAAEGLLPACVALAGTGVTISGELAGGGSNVTKARIEIEAAIREVHEELKNLGG
jgi:hypothetical protein